MKMKAIDMKELLVAMKELEEERGIKKEYMLVKWLLKMLKMNMLRFL